MKYILLPLICFITYCSPFAQENTPQAEFRKNKGRLFVTYGYNRSVFGKSNLHMSGPGYDFTIHQMAAADVPTPFNSYELSHTYINPLNFTVPQFNFHVGWFFKENWSISLGWDHMKYVMRQNQTAQLTGHIDSQVSDLRLATGSYAGTYSDTPVVLAPDFLTFRHTNGFNYASIELENYKLIWTNRKGKLGIRRLLGGGAGAMINRTIVTFFGKPQDNLWNFAGYGVSAKAGLQLDFSKHFYIEGNVKTGYTNLPNIRTTGERSDKANQAITYLEGQVVLGYRFGHFGK